MPVNKQLVPVKLGGINTKVDPKQLQAGQLLTLSNGQFNKIGQINKRYGYDILNTTIEGGGQISAGVQLSNYNNELILFDGSNIYSYLTTTGNWSNRGTAISITTTDNDILRTSAAQQMNPDMNQLNGIEVYAWEDSRGGVRYSVVDSKTDAFAVSDVLLNTTGQQPKVIAFQNQILIFYCDGGANLFYQTVNPFNPTVIQPKIAVVVDGFAGLNAFPYDATVIGNQLFISYLSSSVGTGAIELFYLNNAFFKSAVVVVNSINHQAINAGFHGAINVVGDHGNNCWVSWSNGNDIRIAKYSFTLGNILSSTLVDTGNVVSISGIESPTLNTLLLSYETFHTPSYNEQVRYNTISSAGVLGTAVTIRSVGLMSKAFTFMGNIYINTAYQSILQATDFTFLIANAAVLTTPVIVGKETPGTGGGLMTNGMSLEVPQISPGVFKYANMDVGKIISEANTLFTLTGIVSTELIFTPSDNFINTTQENTLLIVGGILQGYDGVSVTELGFHLYPENITATASGSTGFLSTGSYQYMVEFEWTDNRGQIYRSSPSVPISVVVNSTNSVALSGPMLRLTSKLTPISIVIYRTSANGTTFNRITSTLAPLFNSTTTDTWNFVDTLSDAAALSNELNYTTGAVLPNIAPPANSIICTYNNRVFLAGLSDKLLMWYSQSVVDNSNANTIPPQFSDSLTVGLDPRGGAITALGVLNNVLVIFKMNNIFTMAGNGPDATGNNSDYGDPIFVTSDVGCVNANSVVGIPAGLMFQSAKGIYLLDQGGNVEYIGAQVEAFNNYNITSSICLTMENLVIFTTSQGTSLVYDYYLKEWSTFSNQFALDSVIYNGKFAFVTAAGQVYVQNQNKFTDGGGPILMSLTTPNLSFAGIQGYQRVFRCFILGSYKGPHTLNVAVAYDYNDSYTQFATITPSNNISNWGSDPNWGSGFYWGGQFQLYEFRIDFSVQKCTAIRLQITDNQSSSYNEGYSISSIVFEVGVLPGGNRLGVVNTVAAK